MPPQVTRINHVALVVENMDDALTFWQDALGLTMTHIEDVPGQESRVAFMPVGDSEIELVEPTTGDSGIAKFLAKRGAGFHHVCLEVRDLDALLLSLKEKEVRLINEIPVQGAGGTRVAFIHPAAAGGVLVELVETLETG